jgi:hypothetical protein
VGGAEPTGSAGATDETETQPPRSALADIAEQTLLRTAHASAPPAKVFPVPQPPSNTGRFAPAKPTAVATATTATTTGPAPAAPESAASAAAAAAAAPQADRAKVPPPPEQATRLRAHRREVMAELGEFRRRRVLVPYGENGAALTVEMHGARWLLAFTDEAALARYARARGENDRSWRYRAVWGAAVLDAGVPALAEEAGLPCGVLVDAGDGERGLVLPPVVGIVPEAVAVDRPDIDGGAPEAEPERV